MGWSLLRSVLCDVVSVQMAGASPATTIDGYEGLLRGIVVAGLAPAIKNDVHQVNYARAQSFLVGALKPLTGELALPVLPALSVQLPVEQPSRRPVAGYVAHFLGWY